MTMNIERHINSYLEAHEALWSPTTWTSERARLRALGPVLNLPPQELYERLQKSGRKEYSIKTLFIRVTHYYQWLLDQDLVQGVNPYQEFRARYGWIFRNAYKKLACGLTFEEARIKINTLKDKTCREHALLLLTTGLRISESYKINFGPGGAPFVVGKGGKQRQVFSPTIPESLASKAKLRAALKSIDLKPHDLRKLAATKLVTGGVPLHDVCEIMGWSSLNTAMKYLQASRTGALRQAMEQHLG